MTTTKLQTVTLSDGRTIAPLESYQGNYHLVDRDGKTLDVPDADWDRATAVAEENSRAAHTERIIEECETRGYPQKLRMPSGDVGDYVEVVEVASADDIRDQLRNWHAVSGVYVAD